MLGVGATIRAPNIVGPTGHAHSSSGPARRTPAAYLSLADPMRSEKKRKHAYSVEAARLRPCRQNASMEHTRGGCLVPCTPLEEDRALAHHEAAAWKHSHQSVSSKARDIWCT